MTPFARFRRKRGAKLACLEKSDVAEPQFGAAERVSKSERPEMTFSISPEGLALIMAHEGFLAEPKPLPDGGWVVGYGHVREDFAGAALSENEAVEQLERDLAPIADLVNAKVTAGITQPQFDALASFAFSVGPRVFETSQVLRRVNAGDFIAAACLMDAWRKSEVSGELQVTPALVRRRSAEKAMFLRDLSCEAAPSAFLHPRLDHAAAVLGAPIKYVRTPQVGSVLPAPAKPPAAARLSEILSSEPATEALLLTQVVADDFVEPDAEIATAHARPVARPVERTADMLRRAYAERAGALAGAAAPLVRKALSVCADTVSRIGNGLRNLTKA